MEGGGDGASLGVALQGKAVAVGVGGGGEGAGAGVVVARGAAEGIGALQAQSGGVVALGGGQARAVGQDGGVAEEVAAGVVGKETAMALGRAQRSDAAQGIVGLDGEGLAVGAGDALEAAAVGPLLGGIGVVGEAGDVRHVGARAIDLNGTAEVVIEGAGGADGRLGAGAVGGGGNHRGIAAGVVGELAHLVAMAAGADDAQRTVEGRVIFKAGDALMRGLGLLGDGSGTALAVIQGVAGDAAEGVGYGGEPAVGIEGAFGDARAGGVGRRLAALHRLDRFHRPVVVDEAQAVAGAVDDAFAAFEVGDARDIRLLGSFAVSGKDAAALGVVLETGVRAAGFVDDGREVVRKVRIGVMKLLAGTVRPFDGGEVAVFVMVQCIFLVGRVGDGAQALPVIVVQGRHAAEVVGDRVQGKHHALPSGQLDRRFAVG